MTSLEDGVAPPRLFEHVCTVFAEMRRHSVAQPTTDGGETKHLLVYEGFLTHLFRDLGLPTPYFTSVMERLRAMGCVRQLGRGGGTSPSRWELIQDPDYEDFQRAEESKRKAPSRIEQVEHAQAVLSRQVDQLIATLKDLGIEIKEAS